MAHQRCQVSLGEHGPGRCIAVFYRGGGGHEPVTSAETAQEPTAWRAVQRAAGRRCIVTSDPDASRGWYSDGAFHRASERRSRRRTLWHLA
jgi:hypothetical protein